MAMNQSMHLTSSDSFSTKDALWISDWSSPKWVLGVLERELFYKNAAGGSCQNSNRFGSQCRPDAVVSKPPQRNEYSWTVQILQHTKCGQGRRALKLYEEMQKDGVAPSPYTFVALLKACSSLQDLDCARRIHAEVVRSGLESDLYVATMLVATYSKCRSLVDARDAFEKMPRRDVVSWNAMILGCAQLDKGEEALQLYSRMQQEGVLPDDRTYVSALKACSSLVELGERNERDGIAVRQSCLESVRATHGTSLDWKFELECGGLGNSGDVFEKIYSGTQTVSVQSDTRTCVSATVAQSTSTVFDDRNEGGGVAVVKRQCLETVRAIHAHAVNGLCDSDVFVGNMLIDVYAKCGSLEDARVVFEKMPHRTIVSWNAMIQGYAQLEKGEEALYLYTRMQHEGVIPDERTYVSVLKGCSPSAQTNGIDGMAVKEKCLRTVRAIHKDSVKAKVDLGVFLGTMLVDVYAKCGSLDDARQVFDMMSHRDVVSWTAMILGYAQMDKGEEALELYSRMQQEGVVPDDRTYVGALKACSTLAASNCGFGSCATPVHKKCLETVRAIHSDVRNGKFGTDLFVGNMLMDAYARCGSLEDARCVFDKMPQRTVFSWNAMMLGYAQMNRSEAALQLYMQMRVSGTVPNGQTYVSALKACSSLAELGSLTVKESCLKTVKSIHRDIVGSQFESDAFVGTMLVDVYAKCGSLEDSRRVFEKMAERTVVSWNALISGYAQMGKGEEALELYTRMQIEGTVPDDRTYVIALKACSALAEKNGGGGGTAELNKYLETVRSIHTNMVRQKTEPDVFVRTMLVDVYAKCGRLEDARLVFEKMPHRDVVAWTAMILGYAQMDKSEEALHLYSRMQEEGVAPDAHAYAGLLNACGRVAELEKGKAIHAEILEAGLTAVDFSVSESLIDMYAKCGSMVHAQQVFDAMPRRGIEAWNVLITGYVHQGESQVVFDLFDRMMQEGVQPDDITLLGLLTVCSHVGMVERGQKYFTAMTTDCGVSPTIKHYTCMIDLLGRSGRLDKAMEVLRAMPFQPDSAVWACVLGACQKWGDIELGKYAFQCAVRLDRADAAAYNLMSNIYAAAHMQKEAEQIHTMRLKSRAWKGPGRSLWTDISGMAHEFVVGG